MLDYIKQQLALQHPEVVTFQEEDVSDIETNELVTEYAHIFQELDDISVEGADAHRARALEIDIPIENDVELDTVELNLMDNRLMDVPMDVTAVTEHFNEAMKTYDDFLTNLNELSHIFGTYLYCILDNKKLHIYFDVYLKSRND